MFAKMKFKSNRRISKNIVFNSLKRFTNHSLNKQVHLKLSMPDTSTVEVSIDANQKLSELEAEIKKNSFIQGVEFKSWDYCKISKDNLIKYALEHPLYLKLDKMEWQLVNDIADDIEIQKSINFVNDLKWENTDMFEGLKQKQLIYRDYKDIEQKLKKFVQKHEKSISEEKLFDIAIRLYSVKNLYIHETQGNNIDQNLNETFENYYKAKKDLRIMISQKTNLERKAAFKGKCLILIAPLIFLIQLIAIYIATFQIYSWDITEPMTYLLSIGNIVGILYFRKKFGDLNAHKYYKNMFFRKYVRKGKFDLKKYEELKKKLEDYENNLK